jgi:GWxTD domain-containing protein
MSKGRFTFILAVAFGALVAIPYIQAQTTPDPQTQDPLKRQLSDKDRFKQQKDLKQELHGTYKKWVDEDVHWIITDQELKAFKSLSNDEERDAFIEQFWQRRNPSPDSPENEFREENYRRIAYANEHFAAGKPGWKTDRATSISPSASRTASILIPAAAATTARSKRAAGRRLPSHSKPGTTGISKALATTSTSSLWTPACAGITT